MDALQIVRGAKMAGLCLQLSEDGLVQVFGRGLDYEKWLPILKANKAKIIPVLKTLHSPIAYLAPYTIHYFDPEQGCVVMRPYIETEWFVAEIAKARDFLRVIYLKQIDTVIQADNSLDLVQCGNSRPSSTDWQTAQTYQHGIRAHLLSEPFNLYATYGAEA